MSTEQGEPFLCERRKRVQNQVLQAPFLLAWSLIKKGSGEEKIGIAFEKACGVTRVFSSHFSKKTVKDLLW